MLYFVCLYVCGLTLHKYILVVEEPVLNNTQRHRKQRTCFVKLGKKIMAENWCGESVSTCSIFYLH